MNTIGPIETATRIDFVCARMQAPRTKGGFRNPLSGIRKPRSVVVTLELPDGTRRTYDIADRVSLMAGTAKPLTFWDRLIETCPEKFQVEVIVSSGIYRIVPAFLQTWVDAAKKQPESSPQAEAEVKDKVTS